jgi:hypothetical protein
MDDALRIAFIAIVAVIVVKAIARRVPAAAPLNGWL